LPRQPVRPPHLEAPGPARMGGVAATGRVRPSSPGSRRVSVRAAVPHGFGTEAGLYRFAAPMIGGVFPSFLMEVLLYPVIYEFWKAREIRRATAVATEA